MPRLTRTQQWIVNVELFWRRRFLVLRFCVAGLLLSVLLAFALPRRYQATVTIMPPDQAGGGGGAALLAALSQRSASSANGLGAIAGTLLGGQTRGELYIDLMRSGSVGSALAQQYDLQHVYAKRYQADTLKKLGQRTAVAENKKSGLITLTVTDSDPARARDLANAYVSELNRLLVRVSVSAARRERVFVEQRLRSVQDELQQAQIELSEFSSRNRMVDLKEQTRAMVDAGAKLEAQRIVAQAQLASLRQIYGEENPRVIAARQEESVLQHELSQMSGDKAPDADAAVLSPSLQKLPSLGVQWANLYRRVRVQETVYELLSAQFEAARIQEAREVGTVSVVDAAGLPEKRSFPRRTLTVAAGGIVSFLAALVWIIAVENWTQRGPEDPLRGAWERLREDLVAHGVLGRRSA